MPNIVLLKGVNQVVHKEGTAEAAITPGELVERDATDGQIQAHGTAGGNASPSFANIKAELGGDLDDAYAADEQIRWFTASPGVEVYALVAASAAAIAIGDYLESAGDGTLRKKTAQAVNEAGTATYTIYTSALVARALEAVDNSAGTTEARIKVEVI